MTINDQIHAIIEYNVQSSYSHSSVEGIDEATEKIEALVDDAMLQMARWVVDSLESVMKGKAFDNSAIGLGSEEQLLKRFKEFVYTQSMPTTNPAAEGGGTD